MSVAKYYKVAKVFIIRQLFGWITCIQQPLPSTSNTKGCYIFKKGEAPIYDPNFSFRSPDKFPPKLPVNSNS